MFPFPLGGEGGGTVTVTHLVGCVAGKKGFEECFSFTTNDSRGGGTYRLRAFEWEGAIGGDPLLRASHPYTGRLVQEVLSALAVVYGRIPHNYAIHALLEEGSYKVGVRSKMSKIY